MKKYKLLIKIIAHIIIIYSFFNLYSFRYFFKQIKLPLTQGNIYKRNTSTNTDTESSFTMDNIVLLSNEINFTENTTNYVFEPKKNDNTYYTEKNNNKSVIEWNTDLKRWIKIGNLNEIQEDEFMKDKNIIENIKEKYDKSSEFEGLNLGCVFGNDMLDIHSCKVWKRNFGIGDKPYVAVQTKDKPDLNLVPEVNKRSDPEINKIIPFVIISFVIIILFIIMIMMK